jgi:hypothetical protein
MVNAFNFKPFNKRKKKKENAPKLNKVVPHKYFESHNSDAVCVCVHTAAAFGGGNIGDFPV